MSKSYDGVGVGDEIDQLLNEIDLSGTTGFQRHIYRNMAFDYAYGVRDKSGEEHPFAGVLKQPTEPYFTTTPHQEMLKVFIFYNVPKRTNLSYIEFLELPYPIALDCIAECKVIDEYTKKNAENPPMDADDLEKDMFG